MEPVPITDISKLERMDIDEMDFKGRASEFRQ